MPDLYLHPSITSFITDESQVFVTAQGLTKAFFPHFSTKGEEVLKSINSPDEYIDGYGEPDSGKYGQAQLNIIEWTKAGGEAVCLRLLPEDATYAHAILDFQTKSFDVKKWQISSQDVVKQIDSLSGDVSYLHPDGTTVLADEAAIVAAGGVEVTEEHTALRPKIKIVSSGASSLSAIESYTENLFGLVSEDGWNHHPLGYFYPKGRGSDYYNSLQLKLTANDSLDDTYSFRIFDFELFEEQENGTLLSIDGPFRVSFDPTAMDLSQESMFITDVLSKYGKEVSFYLFQDAFDSLGEAMNPEVDPGLLDPFFLTERNLLAGPTIYHEKVTNSTGITVLSADALIGDTEIYVDDPSLLYVEGTVLVGGIFETTIDEINITTGKVVIADALTANFDESTPVACQPLPEYRQAGISSPFDDSTVTSVLVTQVEDANGVNVLIPGPAIMDLDGDVTSIVINSVDADTKEVVLASSVVLPTGTTLGFIRQYNNLTTDGSRDIDFDNEVEFSGGSVGSLDTSKDSLLVLAYQGVHNEEILLKKYWPIDVILDANYNKAVKDACNQFTSVIRQDCVFIGDLGFTANPQQALDMRASLGYSNFYTALYSQDAQIFDPYAGRNTKVTAPYFIASKIPTTDIGKGIHWPFVGPRRGVLSGFENLSWNPSDAWQERLYRKQVNYIKRDPRRTMLFGQLTSQTVNSALSDLSHVRALLRIQREVENMMEDYQFEFINKTTMTSMNYNLNAYLKGWIDNGCCETIKGVVYASEYDKKSKLVRVRIELVFTSILERVIINLVVK
jgi:hypothetical protein